jgi:hypothetical protein
MRPRRQVSSGRKSHFQPGRGIRSSDRGAARVADDQSQVPGVVAYAKSADRVAADGIEPPLTLVGRASEFVLSVAGPPLPNLAKSARDE